MIWKKSKLTKNSYISEAALYDNYFIDHLKQTIDDNYNNRLIVIRIH